MAEGTRTAQIYISCDLSDAELESRFSELAITFSFWYIKHQAANPDEVRDWYRLARIIASLVTLEEGRNTPLQEIAKEIVSAFGVVNTLLYGARLSEDVGRKAWTNWIEQLKQI